MYNQLYSGIFAGKKLYFSFRHPNTIYYFNEYLKPEDGVEPEGTIHIPVSDCDCWMQDYGMEDDGNTEFGMSVYRASDALIKHDCVIIHAAAMLWHNKAILFSADSGTGKSTQLRHWMDLYGDEVKIMNGDKPVLRLEGDDRFSVHPSPWKGKEEWGDDSLIAPLGGIVFLKQGDVNKIERIKPGRAAPLILTQMFSMFETRDGLSKLCRLEEKMLSSTPVWMLMNKGDEASTILTRETLLEWEEEDHVPV